MTFGAVVSPIEALQFLDKNRRGSGNPAHGQSRIRHRKGTFVMKTLLIAICWCMLFVLSWPLALLVLLLWPVIWLLLLPFRLIGIAFEGVFALLRAIVLLPARLLGYRRPTVS